MKTVLRYLRERIVSTCVFLLNIAVLSASFFWPMVVTRDVLIGLILMNALFIFRGIMWEGQLTDLVGDYYEALKQEGKKHKLEKNDV